jgi:TolB-like protein/DNA-binding winged helix-turn-helix (wHTH) protein
MGALGRGGIFQFEGFRLDCSARALFRRREDGMFVPMVLGSRALDVLDLLVGHAGDLVARDEFMSAVWPATVVEDTNLNVQIASLRRVLDEGRTDGSCIQTIPGRGYRFAVRVTQAQSCAATGSGQRSGNGAGTPITEQPGRKNPPPPSRPGNSPAIFAPPQERKWLWRGSLSLVGGALCLLAAVITASNWHLPQPPQAHPAPRLSIVVLPFTDVGEDSDGQKLADGLTEDLTTELSLVPDILVTSRHSALTYGHKLVDTRQMGHELGVRYVLDGSIQRSGNQLHINAQLIDAEIDTQVWAERYDRDTGDLSALQNEITSRIRNTLSVELISREATRPTEHPDALDYILRARAAWAKGPEREHKAEAVGFFERGLVLDPMSVEAQWQLAIVLTARVSERQSPSPATDIERAEGLVKRALALSPRTPGVRSARAMLLRVEGRCDEAVPEYETVLASNRNAGYALFGIGICNAATGSVDKAILPLEQSIRLDPRDPWIAYRYEWLGSVHLALSHAEEAIVWYERARNASPGIPGPHGHLASAYALRGDTERSVSELAEARKLAGDDRFSSIARLQARGGGGTSKISTLLAANYVAGLRKAGMPKE